MGRYEKRMKWSFSLFLFSLALFGMYVYQTVFVLHRTSVERVVMALIDERIFGLLHLFHHLAGSSLL